MPRFTLANYQINIVKISLIKMEKYVVSILSIYVILCISCKYSMYVIASLA